MLSNRIWQSSKIFSAIVCLSIGSGTLWASTRVIEAPEGTVIPVRIDQKISSRTSLVGDPITGRLDTDKAYYSMFPRGTTVDGYVRDVDPAGRNHPGMVDLEFTQVRFPNGQVADINGSLIGLNNVQRTSSGRLIAKGKQDNSTNAALLGAAGGFIIGEIVKKPLEGTLLGAAAGYLYGQSQKNRARYNDVELKQGSEIGVQLDRAVSFDYNSNSRWNPKRAGTDYGNSGVIQDPYEYPSVNGSYRNRTSRNTRIYNPPARTTRTYNPPVRTTHRNTTINSDKYYDVEVNGEKLLSSSSRKAYFVNDTVMLPLQSVMDGLKQEYSYNSETGEITITTDRGQLSSAVGRDSMLFTDEQISLPTQIVKKNGRVYVPLEFVQALGTVRVSIDDKNRKVFLDNN